MLLLDITPPHLVQKRRNSSAYNPKNWPPSLGPAITLFRHIGYKNGLPPYGDGLVQKALLQYIRTNLDLSH